MTCGSLNRAATAHFFRTLLWIFCGYVGVGPIRVRSDFPLRNPFAIVGRTERVVVIPGRCAVVRVMRSTSEGRRRSHRFANGKGVRRSGSGMQLGLDNIGNLGELFGSRRVGLDRKVCYFLQIPFHD